MPESPYLDRRQAAAFMNISVASLDKLRAEGQGPKAIKIKQRVLFDQADLTAWMDAQKETPPCG
jgi:predicted DNA-binding transcriptional regulator AlpA